MSLLEYECSDAVALIKLDDGKANVLSLEMQAAIGAAIDQAEAEEAAIVLAGRPGMFSGGFDLATLRGGGDDSAAMIIGGFRLAERLLAYPRPVVVGCTGHAVAMGFFLVCVGDYRIGPAGGGSGGSSSGSGSGGHKWVANEVAIGLTMPRAPIEILRLRLTPAVLDRTVNLSLPLGPDEAVTSGYFDRLVPDDAVIDEAMAVAEAAGSLDARAHAASKRRLRAPALAALAAAIEADDEDLARMMAASVTGDGGGDGGDDGGGGN